MEKLKVLKNQPEKLTAQISSEDGIVLIAETYGPTCLERAAFIVKAVNNYDILYSTLGATTEILEILHAKSDHEETRKLLGILIVNNRDTLAKARGEA